MAEPVLLVEPATEDDQLGAEVARLAGLICRAPRELLVGTTAKIRRRTAIDGVTPTLDL